LEFPKFEEVTAPYLLKQIDEPEEEGNKLKGIRRKSPLENWSLNPGQNPR